MSSPSPAPEKATLTDKLRVLTVGIIDPIVTFLARIGVSPNLLTVMGMLLHFLFAWLIINGEFLWAGLAVFIFVPLDALDGSLARKLDRTPGQGKFGAFLDSTSDRTAEVILFSGYLIYFSLEDNLGMMIAAYIAVTGSIMVSYTRSRAEALGLSCKVGLLTRVERYVVIVTSLILAAIWPFFLEVGILILAVGTWFTVGQRVHHVWKQANSTE
jgi:CDP-diacylglycerol--glycerol-3-phosphate 3-phosphatidyltransferase